MNGEENHHRKPTICKTAVDNLSILYNFSLTNDNILKKNIHLDGWVLQWLSASCTFVESRLQIQPRSDNFV